MAPTITPEARRLLAGTTEHEQAREVLPRAATGIDHWVAIVGGEPLRVPRELSALISAVVSAVAAGESVSVGVMPDELTTSEAARMLGISRPTLMKMISAGGLPSHKVGTHTRLRTLDVVEARRRRRERQREAFEALLDLEDDE